MHGRRRPPALALAALCGAVLAAACSSPGHPAASRSTATSGAPTSSSTTAPSTTVAPTTSTTAIPGPPTDPAAKVVVTPTGVVMVVQKVTGPTTYLATSPCGNAVTATGTPVERADVVLDPGHGGQETGAVGPGGTTEKVINLAVAQDVQHDLAAAGLTAVLTRTGDYRVTLDDRAAISDALHPRLFLSIHHNAEPDGPRPQGPGSETYFQIKSAPSKRAAGLVYEEVVKAFSAYPIAWAGDRDAGAKYRPGANGGDYYAVLRETAGTPAVISEAAFLTNPPEEALLRTPAFQAVEAQALTRGVERFLQTNDPGSGYVTPYPRTEPAGGGGGPEGCVDPPLR